MSDSDRVSFGPRPDQDMPASWAQAMLTALYQDHTAQFGRLLARVVTGLQEVSDDERKPLRPVQEAGA
jgi:hypothetical protein